MFFLIVTIVWIVIHTILWRRLVKPLDLPPTWRRSVAGVMLLNTILFPLSFLLHLGALVSSGPVLWAAYLGAGLTMTLLPVVLLRDTLLIAISAISLTTGNAKKFDPSRRQLLGAGATTLITTTSIGIAGYGLYEARTGPTAVTVPVQIKNLYADLEGFRIVHITDVHVGPTIRRPYVERIVDIANMLRPDVICITGDMADGRVDDLRQEMVPFADLTAPHGTYFVTGNHEYYWDCEAWLDEMVQLGMKPLLNEHSLIARGKGKILLAGITDRNGGNFIDSHTSNPSAALHGAPERDITIFLAHQPKSAPAVASAGCELGLYGHTHGGQFFPWNYVVPHFHPIPVGLHHYRGTMAYVSPGAAYWGPPLRSGPLPEVTLLTLTRERA